MTPNELANKYGYAYKGSCFCNGYETHKWKHEDSSTWLQWRKYAGKFQLFQGLAKGKVVDGWQKIQELEETLKKIHYVAVA